MIRLLIADDHPIVLEGLKRIVAECFDMKLVGEAVDGDSVIELATTVEADVLLLDLSMPGPGFLETMARLREKASHLRVVVLSVYPEDQYAVRALRAGASGYLTKDHSADQLAGAVRQVHAGGRYVTPTLAEKLAAGLRSDETSVPHEMLSDREFQVFRALGRGESIKEIAHKLSLSPKTVSTYRTRILQKMEFKSNADLVRYAVEHGLVDL